MKLSLILLLLPTQSLGFAPSSSFSSPISTVAKSTSASILYSSPFDDTPSALSEDSDELSPYDAYTPGVSTKIVTMDRVVGSGDAVAEIGDVLTVALVGKVVSKGTEFLNNEKYAFKLGGGETFPGFNDGLVGCKVGTKRSIKVPPNKAYGQKGAKGIPPMSDLIFEVEVTSIAQGTIEKFIAEVGTDRLAGFALVLVFFAISPFLPH